LLATPDRVRRPLRAEHAARPSGLHLHEHQGPPVEPDDVQLARGEADIAPDDPPAGALEPGGDELLCATPEALPREGHPIRHCAGGVRGARADRNGSVTRM